MSQRKERMRQDKWEASAGQACGMCTALLPLFDGKWEKLDEQLCVCEFDSEMSPYTQVLRT